MDRMELIQKLRTESLYKDKATLEIMDLCMAAADVIDQLTADNSNLREQLASVTAERDAAQKALEAMRFAYINKDFDCPHQFELSAMKQANEILGEFPQKEV